MGQYSAIGIVSKMSVAKEEVHDANITVEQLQEKIQQEFNFTSQLYEISENDKAYYFHLKESVLAEQLIPFLEKVYPLLYEKSDYYEKILEKLKTMPPTEWMDWAYGKPEEAFQFDRYGEPDYLRVGFSDITIEYESILLSLEGKVVMEFCGRHFNFFKAAMMQAFNDFSLAGALRIYISG